MGKDSKPARQAQTSGAPGIRYFQFLQPNQYLPDSKPLSTEEQRIAYEPDSPCRGVVEQGYPLLQAAGRNLRQAGVEFVDLSRTRSMNRITVSAADARWWCEAAGGGSRVGAGPREMRSVRFRRLRRPAVFFG